MEEDVEIELLLISNEKMLLEAVEETKKIKSHGIDQSEKNTLNLTEETITSQNKENITENMIHDYEESSFQLAETTGNPRIPSQVYEANGKVFTHDALSDCDFDNALKVQNHTTSSISGEFLQNVRYVENAEDQLNQHILDLIATDPVKYYLSKQTSYNSEFEDTSSDDDWCSDFGFKDDDFTDMIEDPQLKSLHKSQHLGNTPLKNIQAKSVPLLTTLGKMLLKRDNFLSELESKLHQLSLKNKEKQQKLRDALVGREKIKMGESTCTRISFRKFGIPYFSDNKGYYAPPNKEHQQKIDNNEIMIESVPKTNSWVEPHKEIMKNAIKQSLITEKSTKLLKEITKLQTLLFDTSLKIKKDKAIKLQEKMIEKQNELRGLYKKSYYDLVMSESDDREYDWMKFSASLFGGIHSAEECKKFWNTYLKPSINKKSWRESEDSRLIELSAQMEHQDWEKIAKLLGTNRTAFQCFVHYKARLEERNDYTNGKWTHKEDSKLLNVINSSKLGSYIPWAKISSYMDNRDMGQIYNRWSYTLNPDLVKGRFSKEEDLLIVSGVEVFGVTFKELASLMTNRTSSQIRERYERHLLPKTSKVGIWSLEEDEHLLRLVEKYGARKWHKISEEMRTRTRTQARQRYAFIEKMMKKNPGWTIAQVKRRNISFSNNTGIEKVNKDVENIKRDFDAIKRVFHLSEIEKETFLFEKLIELRGKIFRKSSKRGRKRKEKPACLEVNDILLGLFKHCSSKSLSKTSMSPPYEGIESKLNELFLLSKFFGITLKLPKSEKEVRDNPRLNYACKVFLKCVLNRNPSTNSPERTPEQKIVSASNLSKVNCVSTHVIDYEAPEQDDTIIMMDWWHTPPINIARLNFSEFFKRTVFDYSSGMHKDIWNSKVRRSQAANPSYDYPVNEDKKHTPDQNYAFPPNQFTALAMRSILLNRGFMELQAKEEGILKNSRSILKEEVSDAGVDDDCCLKVDSDAIHSACDQFTNRLISLLMWPKVLLVTKIGTVPIHKVQHPLKRREVLQVKSTNNNLIVSCNSNDNINNEQINSSTNSNVLQEQFVPEEEANQKQQPTITDVACSRKLHTEQLVKKRNLSSDSLSTGKKKGRGRKKSVTKKMKRTTINKTNQLKDTSLSNEEISESIKSKSFHHSTMQKSKKMKSCNTQQENQSLRQTFWSSSRDESNID